MILPGDLVIISAIFASASSTLCLGPGKLAPYSNTVTPKLSSTLKVKGRDGQSLFSAMFVLLKVILPLAISAGEVGAESLDGGPSVKNDVPFPLPHVELLKVNDIALSPAM